MTEWYVPHKECASPPCQNKFLPSSNNQFYCSKRCAEREKARQKRQKRKENNLCIYCAKPLEEIRILDGVSHCQKCADYFRSKKRRG